MEKSPSRDVSNLGLQGYRSNVEVLLIVLVERVLSRSKTLSNGPSKEFISGSPLKRRKSSPLNNI